MAKRNAVGTAINLAHHIKAIADIVKAALAGGAAGAAVAAVKHYWPQILAICCGIFLLPILLFICLPAFIFTSAEADLPDEIIESYYGEYQALTDEHIELIKSSFLVGSGESNTSDYDKKSVVKTVKTEGVIMDIYWVTAINSVYNSNKLPTDESINGFTQNLVSTEVTEEERQKTVTNDEGEEYTVSFIERTLYITYKDPYDLMNHLNFTEEQVAWAETMYGVISGTISDTAEFSHYYSGIVSSSGFANPLPFPWRDLVSSEFSWRADPFTGDADNHTGIDIKAAAGTDIRASMDGVVETVVYGLTGYGYFVKINHGNGLQTMYCHCSKIYVTAGQTVRKGDIIAAVGSTGKSTGPHLHFEVRVNGKAINPRPLLP